MPQKKVPIGVKRSELFLVSNPNENQNVLASFMTVTWRERAG
jgi:hypothetical protein